VSLGGCVARSQLSHLGDSQGRLILEDPLTGVWFAVRQFLLCAYWLVMLACHVGSSSWRTHSQVRVWYVHSLCCVLIGRVHRHTMQTAHLGGPTHSTAWVSSKSCAAAHASL
jgi:hypothetical protein